MGVIDLFGGCLWVNFCRYTTKKERDDNMAIGIGFANDEYNDNNSTIEDYYYEELNDAPIGAGGFVKDICYERAVERYESE